MQERHSFWRYALSQRFACHLVWLSVIQLWHYLFIGTLNSLLTNLAGGDRALGAWWGLGAAHLVARILEAGGLSLAGRKSEQGCGEEGQAGKGRLGESPPVRQCWKRRTTQPLSALRSQHLHKCLRHYSVLRGAVCPLERPAHGPAQAEVPEGSQKHR